MLPWSAPNSEEPVLLPLPEVEKGPGKSLGAFLQQGPLGAGRGERACSGLLQSSDGCRARSTPAAQASPQLPFPGSSSRPHQECANAVKIKNLDVRR